MEPNSTAWVDRNITRFWDAMHRVVPDESWLPKADVSIGRGGKRKVVAEEYGCGHYGCVMPTDAEDTVLKLTSDIAEAAFVRAAIEISDKEKGSGDKWTRGFWPDGIVRYKAIYRLAGVTHRKRPVFLIWRQEAFDTGFLVGIHRDKRGWEYQQSNEALNLLDNAKAAAAFTRDWIKRTGKTKQVDGLEKWAWNRSREHFEVMTRSPYQPYGGQGRETVTTVIQRYRGAERAALGVAFYAMGVEMMRHNNALVSTVGMAMDYYLDRGIVLADVHLNNIGKIKDPEYDGLVTAITDPGHAVFLNGDYDALTVEEMDP